MKKYRVTEKHPEIKEGIIFKRHNGDMCLSPSCFVHIHDGDIQTLLEKEWIQEIRKHEFTKDDIVEFLEYLLKQNDRHCEIDVIEFVDEWINNKNEKQKL